MLSKSPAIWITTCPGFKYPTRQRFHLRIPLFTKCPLFRLIIAIHHHQWVTLLSWYWQGPISIQLHHIIMLLRSPRIYPLRCFRLHLALIMITPSHLVAHDRLPAHSTDRRLLDTLRIPFREWSSHGNVSSISLAQGSPFHQLEHLWQKNLVCAECPVMLILETGCMPYLLSLTILLESRISLVQECALSTVNPPQLWQQERSRDALKTRCVGFQTCMQWRMTITWARLQR